MMCLHSVSQTVKQIVEEVMVEYWTSTFKPMNWVLCHQPATLEEAVVLMEAYASTEVGLYIIPKIVCC